MPKVTCDFNYGESVIIMLRTTVQQTIELGDGTVEVVTDHGAFHSEDNNLIGVFPDPED